MPATNNVFQTFQTETKDQLGNSIFDPQKLWFSGSAVSVAFIPSPGGHRHGFDRQFGAFGGLPHPHNALYVCGIPFALFVTASCTARFYS